MSTLALFFIALRAFDRQRRRRRRYGARVLVERGPCARQTRVIHVKTSLPFTSFTTKIAVDYGRRSLRFAAFCRRICRFVFVFVRAATMFFYLV